MKNLIMKIATLAAIIFGLSGCSSTTINGLSLNNDSVLKDNSKTKVYYEDLSEKFVVEANKKIVEDLNSSDIIPIKWYTLANQKEATGITNSKYTSIENDLRKKVENGKFKVSNDGTKIVFEKQYTDLVAQLEDIQNIYSYLNFSLITDKDIETSFNKRDTYLTASIYFDKENSNMQELVFFTRYSFFHDLVKNGIKKQIELGSWEMVDSPEKADKEIYFELSRDYFPAELKYLRKNKKGIKFVSLDSGNKFNIEANNKGKNNSSHIGVGQSAMNLASSSNGDLTSAAIGLAVAGVFSLFEDTPKKENTIINEYSGVFASIRVIDKIKNTDNVKLYDTYINNDMFDTRNNLFKKIHETINIDPNSKKYNIN